MASKASIGIASDKIYGGVVGEDVPELPEPKPEELAPEGEPKLDGEPKPDGELDGELDPNPDEDDPEPNVEFVPPPRREAFAFSCSIRGS